MPRKQAVEITCDQLLRIYSTITSNDWIKNENIVEVVSESSKWLYPSELNLYLELIKSYKKYELGDYIGLIEESFSNGFENFLSGGKKLFVASLVAPDDLENVEPKSGDMIVYVFKSLKLPFEQKRIETSKNWAKLLDNRSHKTKKIKLLLVDDFIGTGDTAKKAINGIRSHRNWNSSTDEIAIFSIVIHKGGLDKLKHIVNDVIYRHTIDKGISKSDNWRIVVKLDECLKANDNIEKFINVHNKMKRGYGEQEALISMVRTPNNTLPVFWLGRKSHGIVWRPAFPRNVQKDG